MNKTKILAISLISLLVLTGCKCSKNKSTDKSLLPSDKENIIRFNKKNSSLETAFADTDNVKNTFICTTNQYNKLKENLEKYTGCYDNINSNGVIYCENLAYSNFCLETYEILAKQHGTKLPNLWSSSRNRFYLFNQINISSSADSLLSTRHYNPTIANFQPSPEQVFMCSESQNSRLYDSFLVCSEFHKTDKDNTFCIGESNHLKSILCEDTSNINLNKVITETLNISQTRK